MPQLVGRDCVLCLNRISSSFDAMFCDHCGNPVHRECAKSNVGGELCEACGSDPSSTEAAEYQKQKAEFETLQRKAESWAVRPTSVTVICWLLIVGNLFSIIKWSTQPYDPRLLDTMAEGVLPIPAQFQILYIDRAVLLTCGIAMLFAQNWARWLYFIWGVIGMIIVATTSPMKMMLIPMALLLFVVAYFLFRPAATLFFTGGASGLHDTTNAA